MNTVVQRLEDIVNKRGEFVANMRETEWEFG